MNDSNELITTTPNNYKGKSSQKSNKESNEDTVSVQEFEQQVRNVEEVRLHIRAPRNKKVKAYPFKRKLSDTSTISDLKKRISGCLDGDDYDIVMRDGTPARANRKLGNVRVSY